MARAKRHFIPGYIWHITHRCHKREFLLKFSKDRHRYLQWLYQAKKRYKLTILNYMVTSNHVHLLVVDTGKRDVIPKSMQLVAGRTGQEYNQRKNRKGAYWEDRYHATAVESGEHLARCMVYIDIYPVKCPVPKPTLYCSLCLDSHAKSICMTILFNRASMVRAGVVSHPSLWSFSGYNEIQEPRRKNILIDYEKLQLLIGSGSYDQLKSSHRGWVEEYLGNGAEGRQDEWTDSIAVGSKPFIEKVKSLLGFKAKGRDVIEGGEGYHLREEVAPYTALFRAEKDDIGPENAYFWDVNTE